MGKSKFDRVRYLRISRISLEIVVGLSEQDKATFLDKCLTWFQTLEQGKEIEIVETENILLNLALREEISELQEGFEKYMQSVHAPQKSNANANDTPIHPADNADDTPIHLSEQTNQNDIYIQTINQIKSDLIPHGYTADEIDRAYHSVGDWTEIGNPSGYIRKTIDNERSRPLRLPKKKIPAQDFPQRDYSGVDEEMIKQLEKEVEEMKASNQ